MQKTNKKGQLGMDTVKMVMVFLLTLAVIAIALFLGLSNLTSENVLSRKTVDGSLGTITNSSFVLNSSITPGQLNVSGLNIISGSVTAVNGSGAYVPCNGVAGNYSSVQCIIGIGNFTFNTGGVQTATGGNFNGNRINMTFRYTETVPSDGVLVVGNVTKGTTDFFNDIPTVFAILGAVVIILAIVLIIFAVNRFDGFSVSGGSNSDSSL